ncbi:hypothetical protein R1sor_005408 [Riccia sorocarpa]|uniref:Ubiquitin-like protease family profile domain-containing protein n=1 Tax=Riccia sorocarpa TaxID=122646 RepID=A0ABD3HJP3_9MARC
MRSTNQLQKILKTRQRNLLEAGSQLRHMEISRRNLRSSVPNLVLNGVKKGLILAIEKVDDIRYIIVPIHTESHWSLVLIHISDTRDACVIYHMDSIKTYHDHSQIGALLNTWLDRGLGLNMETSIVSIGITQQTNNFDCGVHVLYIITKLIEAGKNGQLLEYLENAYGGLPKE